MNLHLAFPTEPFAFFLEDRTATKSPITITLSPKPGSLYRIQRRDTLLTLAGTAYAAKPGALRLSRAQLINRHPFNWRYHTPGKQSFTQEFFPEGIVSFYPGVSCADADLNFPQEFPPSGKCYPLVFIPHETDIWFQPSSEVVQPDSITCWAAAILSGTTMMPGVKKFTSIKNVIDFFRKLELKIPLQGNLLTHHIVNASGALVRWPKKSVTFEIAKGRKIVVPAGQLTLELVARELELSLIVKDDTLTLEELHSILANSQSPVIGLRFAKNKVGHATVIFGISKAESLIGEMDPFPNPKRPTGPAWGIQKTRWLPTFNAFKRDANDNKSWEEFAFFFKRKNK